MSTKHVLLAVLLVAGLLLAAAAGPRLVATAETLTEEATSAQPGITIPYPGHLTRDNARAVPDGSYDLTFALYDRASGGQALWSETQTGVAVKGGNFIVSLGSVTPIPPALLTGGERWLATGVRGPGESDFTMLNPRQRLSPTSSPAPVSPAAGPACPHDHWGESWEGTGIGLNMQIPSGDSTAQLISIFSAVYGYHEVFYGVLGKSNGSGIGVGGDSRDRYSVWGHSTNSFGGWFESDSDHLDLALGGHVGRINTSPDDQESLLYLSSNADVIIKLDNDGGENHALRVKNSGGGDVCTISEAGDLQCTGTKSAVVDTANQGQRLLYAIESPEVWFEDFGTASLEKGKATVAFDPLFAETVNLSEGYHVFLTPLAEEPVLLFVTAKSAGGFTVQGTTLDGRPAQAAFDYRIVAKRLGYEDVRLAPATEFATSEAEPEGGQQ